MLGGPVPGTADRSTAGASGARAGAGRLRRLTVVGAAVALALTACSSSDVVPSASRPSEAVDAFGTVRPPAVPGGTAAADVAPVASPTPSPRPLRERQAAAAAKARAEAARARAAQQRRAAAQRAAARERQARAARRAQARRAAAEKARRTAPKPSTAPRPPRATPGASGPAREVLRLVNVERAAAGCKPLVTNAVLARVALAHSRDMAVRGYFAHDSQDGRSPFDRMRAAGYRGTTMGENIAAGQTTAAAVMSAWMKSPGHRANILNCSYRELGVGYHAGGSMRHYWTQNFGAR